MRFDTPPSPFCRARCAAACSAYNDIGDSAARQKKPHSTPVRRLNADDADERADADAPVVFRR